MASPTSVQQSETLKQKGNSYFTLKDYSNAILQYSKAIIIDSTNPILFANRALCYLKLSNYPAVELDCEAVLAIDPLSFKAHNLMGQALMHDNERLNEALRYLTKAYNLSVTQKAKFTEEINQSYRTCKRKKWEIDEEKRRTESSCFYRYLKGLVDTDNHQKRKNLDSESDLEFADYEHKHVLNQLDQLLSSNESTRKRVIPEQFLGKISLEIMTDPIITPCGISYDRTEILQHLSRIGKFDPLSRKSLDESMLVPNLALKETIDAYLEVNGWALDY